MSVTAALSFVFALPPRTGGLCPTFSAFGPVIGLYVAALTIETFEISVFLGRCRRDLGLGGIGLPGCWVSFHTCLTLS